MNRFALICVVCALSLSTGCATSYRIGQEFNPNAVDKIVLGKTSQEDVVNLLGQPLKTGLSHDNEIYIYQYTKVTFKSRGLFRVNYDVKKSGNTLVIEFDQNKRVKDVSFNAPGREPELLSFVLLHHELQRKSRSGVRRRIFR